MNSTPGLQYDIKQFVLSLQRVIGAEKVTDDPEAILHSSQNCGEITTRPAAVIRARTRQDIQNTLALAGEMNVSVYPISAGCNWGYGSGCPSQNGSVLLDLREMNSIVEYNEELAYVVLEPGVTQQQLFDYLQSKGAKLRADVTGSAPEASVLGSILERGFGLSPYGERINHALNFEVVLADGTVCETGFGRFGDTQVKHLHRWGIGPSLDGLLTQSNFGIVSRFTLHLMPNPEREGVLLVSFDSDAELKAALPSLRALKMEGILKSPIHIASELRVIASIQQHPQHDQKTREMLSFGEIEALRKHFKLGAWNIVAGMWGSRARLAVDVSIIKKRLKRWNARFYSDRLLEVVRKFSRPAKMVLGSQIERQIKLLDLFRGKPSQIPLFACYWRKAVSPRTQTFNIAADKCGVMWCSPVFPMTEKDLQKFIAMIRAAFVSFGFEFNVAISMVTDRALCGTIGIFFDAEDREESVRAHALHALILRECLAEGYPPYRLGASTTDLPAQLTDHTSEYRGVIKSLKNALDPSQVIAPGRYGI